MSNFDIDSLRVLKHATTNLDTIEDVVKNFRYEQRLIFDKSYYDVPTEIIDGYWRILKLTDPRTFEYKTITTSVDFIFRYIDSGGEIFSKIIINTIDDAFMNLWLKKQDDDTIFDFIRYFRCIPMLHSCEFEYEAFIRRFDYLISNKSIIEVSFN